MFVDLNPNDVNDYRRFLAIKQLPQYRISGRTAWLPDEYASLVGVKQKQRRATKPELHADLFDYQRDIAGLAIRKQKFAVFADCGLGKTLILLEFARHAAKQLHGTRAQRVLIASPLMIEHNDGLMLFGNEPQEEGALR